MTSFAPYDPSMGITQDQYQQEIARTEKQFYGGGLSSVLGSLFGPVRDRRRPLKDSRVTTQSYYRDMFPEFTGNITAADAGRVGRGGSHFTPEFREYAQSKGYEVDMTPTYMDGAPILYKPGERGDPNLPGRGHPKPSGIGGPKWYDNIYGEEVREGGLSLEDFIPKPPPVLATSPCPDVMRPTSPRPDTRPPPVMPRPAGVSSGDNPLGGPRYGRLPTGRDISRLVSSDDPAIRPPSILLKNMRHGGSLTHTVLDILRSLS